MNRLILIGNGFDLAHGLKTSYKDFIHWYIHSCFKTAFYEMEYVDPLVKITRGNYFQKEPEARFQWVETYLSNFAQDDLQVTFGFDGRTERNSPQYYDVNFKSDLLKQLLKSSSVEKWVDIEGEFYEQLKSILDLKQASKKGAALVDLNESLKVIIKLLEAYLIDLPAAPYLNEYDEIFTSKINAVDLYPKRSDAIIDPKETHILDFNYTNTISQYLTKINDSPSRKKPLVNFIHGELQNDDNELIFGFGDEVDPMYKKMEDDSKVIGYFEYIKSFWYLRTVNYRTLVNFIDSDDFQVYILGHSCGLSDRTMLQTIFEHPQCRSIKIYYHKHGETDNFVSLTHEIARHFSDKGLMRKRIVPKERSSTMPQAL
jgi:hypothetical protein